jgi:hypothetical protein
MPAVSPDVVTARPIRMGRIGWTASAIVLVVFVVTALVMKRDNAGADFDTTDQIGTLVVGVIVAMLFIMPTWPRLRADAEAVRLRSFLGGYRTVPWEVIVRIDFPSNVRFARVVLPGDEALAIYAVQRMDRERAVAVMDQLRELSARVHAQ